MTSPGPLPPQAVTAAAAVLHEAGCSRPGCSHGEADIGRGDLELATGMLEAAAPHLAAAERQRLYAELGNDHYVIFTEDRWTVEHSVECRLSGHMPGCAHHEAVARIAGDYEPAMNGRWKITSIDSEGMPGFERAEVRP